MDRRQFFGSIAALAFPRLFPARLPYEAPTLTPLPFRVRDIREAVAVLRANNIEAGADGMLELPIQVLNTALPRYEGYRRFSPFEFEVTAP